MSVTTGTPELLTLGRGAALMTSRARHHRSLPAGGGPPAVGRKSAEPGRARGLLLLVGGQVGLGRGREKRGRKTTSQHPPQPAEDMWARHDGQEFYHKHKHDRRNLSSSYRLFIVGMYCYGYMSKISDCDPFS